MCIDMNINMTLFRKINHTTMPPSSPGNIFKKKSYFITLMISNFGILVEVKGVEVEEVEEVEGVFWKKMRVVDIFNLICNV